VRMMKLRRMRWVRHLACLGELRNIYNSSVGRSEGREHLGNFSHTCVANIKVDFKEMGWKGVGWIHLA
jgi:hypothetical protein